MDPITTGALIVAGGNALGNIMGLFGGGDSNKVDMETYIDTLQRQKEASMELQQHSGDVATQTYQRTMDYNLQVNSPKAQAQRYQEAGLNPALMYSGGASGAGGISGQAVAGGGSASGSDRAGSGSQQASRALQATATMDIASKMAGVKLANAQANLANAEAENARGVVREKTVAETGNIQAETLNTLEQTKNQSILRQGYVIDNRIGEVRAEIAEATSTAEVERVYTELNKSQRQIEKLLTEIENGNLDAELKERSMDNLVKLQQVSIQEGLAKIFVLGTEGQLNQQQAVTLAESILQKWEEVRLESIDTGNKIIARDQEDERLRIMEKALDVELEKMGILTGTMIKTSVIQSATKLLEQGIDKLPIGGAKPIKGFSK